jgi:hypothetical protein
MVLREQARERIHLIVEIVTIHMRAAAPDFNPIVAELRESLDRVLQ